MDKKTLECPVCGEHINVRLEVCPFCGEPTGFPPVEEEAKKECMVCGETISAETTVCPVCGENCEKPLEPPAVAVAKPTPVAEQPSTVVEQSAATTPPVHTMPPAAPKPVAAAPPPPPPPPPTPTFSSQQPRQGYPPTPNGRQMEPKKKKTAWGWILLVIAILAGIGVGTYFLYYNKNKKTETAEALTSTLTTYSEVLDSIERSLPVSATVVTRLNNDEKPCLFYIENGRLFYINAKDQEKKQIEPSDINHNAVVDYKAGGIIRVDVTPSEKALILLVFSKGVEESGLYRYWIKDNTIDILGFGEINIDGNDYIIRGINMERHIDNSGNVIKEFDPGLTEKLTESDAMQDKSNKSSEKSQSSSPKMKGESKKQHSESMPPTPEREDPPVKNNGTGFHFEEI